MRNDARAAAGARGLMRGSSRARSSLAPVCEMTATTSPSNVPVPRLIIAVPQAIAGAALRFGYADADSLLLRLAGPRIGSRSTRDLDPHGCSAQLGPSPSSLR